MNNGRRRQAKATGRGEQGREKAVQFGCSVSQASDLPSPAPMVEGWHYYRTGPYCVPMYPARTNASPSLRCEPQHPSLSGDEEHSA
jgi:hypothetical protein